MPVQTASSLPRTKDRLDKEGKRGLVKEGLRVLLQGLIIFLCAGRIGWPRGWIFLGLVVSANFLGVVYLAGKDPRLLNKRGRLQAGTKGFDRPLLALIFLLSYCAMALSSLDGGRFGWSQPWTAFLLLGGLMFILGSLLITWSMAVNPHFEAGVRIQEDRGHRVCSGGPYRLVRHPGYLGWVVILVSIPLILGSWWGLFPAGLAGSLLVVRTALEDRALRRELTGYRDYARTTRSRLIPFVW